ncbi:MAG: hypothetical protein ABIK68_06955 [bacterium]
MKVIKQRLLSSVWALMITLFFAATLSAAEDYQLSYQAKVKQNDGTIAIIAGVINYVCPRLVPESTKICNPSDPVGSAVGVQKYMEKDWNKAEDDIEDAKMPELLNKKAALQFWDAVEQFKEHYPYRAKARKLAEEGKWQDAFLNEEMAWQYLVKCASRGIFSKKIVDGE